MNYIIEIMIKNITIVNWFCYNNIFQYLCIYNKINNEINIIYGKNDIIVYRLYSILNRHYSAYEQNIRKGYNILFLSVLWRNHYGILNCFGFAIMVLGKIMNGKIEILIKWN